MSAPCVSCEETLCPGATAVLEGTIVVQRPPTVEITAIHGVPSFPVEVGDQRLTVGPSTPVFVGDEVLAYLEPGSGTVLSFARIETDGSVRCPPGTDDGNAAIPAGELAASILAGSCPATLQARGVEPAACDASGCSVGGGAPVWVAVLMVMALRWRR